MLVRMKNARLNKEITKLNNEIAKLKKDIDSWIMEVKRQEAISAQRKAEIDSIEKNFKDFKNDSSIEINNMNTKNTDL